MHILVSPNAYKNSLDATASAEAICAGLLSSRLECTTESFPIGDGGDGTAGLLVKRGGGTLINCQVRDPLGRFISSNFGLVNGGDTAIIEMADASGLRLLAPDELNPLYATSFGTGQLISHALDRNVSHIIICIGGSATVDGACGMLQALGVRFLDANDKELSKLPANLVHLEKIDLANLDDRALQCKFTILCDVENLLLGDQGAAKVFGPQKGASDEDVLLLDAGLTRFRDVVQQQMGRDMSLVKHGGAAGGTAAGLHSLLNAELVNGIDHFLAITGFENALQKADLLITGEGSIDEQTLHGKAPFGVAVLAKRKGIPVIGLSGKLPIDASETLHHYFDVLLAIGNGPVEMKQAMRDAEANLFRTAREVGNMIALWR
ncbi:MAG: glycerate kinase [Chitinophagaceae bacterium]